MPPSGVDAKPREEILRLEEVLDVAKIALQLGFSKIRLTGGEPLLRKGLIPFIKNLNLLPGLKDLALTTNGLLLPQLAGELHVAGVHRLNISLDTLDPDMYRRLTGGGDFNQVWTGLTRAIGLGFDPIKINAVALKGVNDDQWVALARLSGQYPIHVRFIELMPVGSSWETAGDGYASCREVQSRIEGTLGKLIPTQRVAGNGPAQYFRLPGAAGTIGFIHAISEHFCGSCNRLRLTADGKLRPCLLSQQEVDLRQAIRSGAGDQEIQNLFRKAILIKSSSYHRAEGSSAGSRVMAQIGG
jgi:cyclic pyranopterin phosphate synthase